MDQIGLESTYGWQASTKITRRSSVRKLDLDTSSRGFTVLINEELEGLNGEVMGVDPVTLG